MHNPPLVLVADDDEDFKEILSTKLLGENFEVAEAKDGREAIIKAKSLLPDLIVMDIQMPEVNGTEAVLELARNQATKGIKIVFFSNLMYPWPGVKKDKGEFSKELGAITFLSKEDDLTKIITTIKELLAQS
ncbi:MAG: response regulator [Candidatus Paceibacterota bacterium]